MIGWNNIGHFRELSINEGYLNHEMEANIPHTNSPSLGVVHKNPIE